MSDRTKMRLLLDMADSASGSNDFRTLARLIALIDELAETLS